MSLFRHALINSNMKKFLKTIRYELILTPAYLGRTKDKHILYLARSLKTRQSLFMLSKMELTSSSDEVGFVGKVS